MILPAIPEIVGKTATQPGSNPLAAQKGAQHERKVAAGPDGALRRLAANAERTSIATQNKREAFGNRQGISGSGH